MKAETIDRRANRPHLVKYLIFSSMYGAPVVQAAAATHRWAPTSRRREPPFPSALGDGCKLVALVRAVPARPAPTGQRLSGPFVTTESVSATVPRLPRRGGYHRPWVERTALPETSPPTPPTTTLNTRTVVRRCGEQLPPHGGYPQGRRPPQWEQGEEK